MTSSTPSSSAVWSMSALMASAWPETVKAASLASGSEGGSGATEARRSAKAWAISAPWPRRPDARAVDARAPTIDQNRIDHQIEVLLPIIDGIFAEEDLAEAWAMHLNRGVAFVLLDGRQTAEDEAPWAILEDGGADVSGTRVDRNGLLGHAGGVEGLRHTPRSPWLLGAGFEHQAHLQRHDR